MTKRIWPFTPPDFRHSEERSGGRRSCLLCEGADRSSGAGISSSPAEPRGIAVFRRLRSDSAHSGAIPLPTAVGIGMTCWGTGHTDAVKTRSGFVLYCGGAGQGNCINHSDLRKKRSKADFEIAQEKPIDSNALYRASERLAITHAIALRSRLDTEHTSANEHATSTVISCKRLHEKNMN